MTVLVTAASKHGGTREIADVIGATLREADLDVVVLPAGDVGDLRAFEAVVLGSGVYAGHWLPAALELAERTAGELGERPVWLFSSGPVGKPLKPDGDPVDVGTLLEQTGARDHRLFGGRIDRRLLGFGERALCAALRVPEGDFRPWPQVRAWAQDIGHAIVTGATGGWEREATAGKAG